MNGTRFQKTETGRQALQQRRALADPRLRTLLILCNGRATLQQLQVQLGPQTEPLMVELLRLGLVEDADIAEHIELAINAPEVAQVPPAPAPPPPPPPLTLTLTLTPPPPQVSPAPQALPSPPAPPPAAETASPSRLPELRAMKQRAMTLVESLFGPNGGQHGPAILGARDESELERALAAVHGSISVYQGRKRADALLRQVRLGPGA